MWLQLQYKSTFTQTVKPCVELAMTRTLIAIAIQTKELIYQNFKKGHKVNQHLKTQVLAFVFKGYHVSRHKINLLR